MQLFGAHSSAMTQDRRVLSASADSVSDANTRVYRYQRCYCSHKAWLTGIDEDHGTEQCQLCVCQPQGYQVFAKVKYTVQHRLLFLICKIKQSNQFFLLRQKKLLATVESHKFCEIH